MLKAAASLGPGPSLAGGPLRAAQSGGSRGSAPTAPCLPLHPAAQAHPATLPRTTTWTAATAPKDPSTHPRGARASPPPTPASVPPARTSGPTGNGAGHAACLQPAGPHTDLSGVPHAPRLRRPVSCRHPAPATGRPPPVPAGSRARTRQKKPGGQGRAAGRAEGKTTHAHTGTGDRGPGRAGGRTESVMEAPGQQRKKSVKRGEREGGPPSGEAPTGGPRLCGVPATGHRGSTKHRLGNTKLTHSSGALWA